LTHRSVNPGGCGVRKWWHFHKFILAFWRDLPIDDTKPVSTS
jgi:hypothetical protein